MANRFLTPAALPSVLIGNDNERLEVLFLSQEAAYLIAGAIAELADPGQWELFGAVTEQEASDYFDSYLRLLFADVLLIKAAGNYLMSNGSYIVLSSST